MISVPLISQRSVPANNKLGSSTLTSIANYGCALTCVSVIAGRTDLINVNKLLVDNGAFVDTNLMYWLKVPNALPQLKFVWRGQPYDNAKVRDWIYNRKFPVIVEVDAAPIGSPKSSHFVVYLGDAMLFDPWTGRIRPTSDFPNPKAFILYEVTKPAVKMDDGTFRAAVAVIVNSDKVADAQIKAIKAIL